MIPLPILKRLQRQHRSRRVKYQDYQIDPHLRHDFPSPQRRRRLRLWWTRLLYRLGRWLLSLPLFRPGQETASLQLLILLLTFVVLFQALVLVLRR